MRRSTWLTALAVVLAIGGAQVPQAQADNSQQNKMTSCNADATTQGLKGDDRKAYMKTCLSKAKNSQQEKMKSCNADATTKGLKGADRKAYMKTCLSGSSTGH